MYSSSSSSSSSSSKQKKTRSNSLAASKSTTPNSLFEGDFTSSPVLEFASSPVSEFASLGIKTPELTTFSRQRKGFYERSGGSRSSSRSTGTITPSLKLDEYFRNLLYAHGEQSKNIENVESLFLNNEQLQTKIIAITHRNSPKVETDNFRENKIRASLVCYKKGDLEETFREIKIVPVAIEISSAKESILQLEMAEAESVINERREEISEKIRELLAQEGVEEKIIEIAGLKANRDSSDRLLNPKVALEKFIGSAKTYKQTLLEAEAGGVEKIREKLKIFKVKFDENEIDPQSLANTLESSFISKLNLTKLAGIDVHEETSLSSILAKSEEIYAQREQEFKSKIADPDYIRHNDLNSELEKCEALLEREGALAKVVSGQRGHSEDFLYYSLQQKGYMEEVKRQAMEGGECDRFYLIVSSTRDSCNRCSMVVEKISDFLRESLNPTKDPTIDCKVLYFANRAMTNENGTSWVKSYTPDHTGGLSEGEGSVINASPASRFTLKTIAASKTPPFNPFPSFENSVEAGHVVLNDSKTINRSEHSAFEKNGNLSDVDSDDSLTDPGVLKSAAAKKLSAAKKSFTNSGLW